MIDRWTMMAAGPGDSDGIEEIETGVATRTRPRTKKASNYKVLRLNDDYTPMEFVVLVLQRFFSMSIEDATRVILQAHKKGIAVCGVFTYEVAEPKVSQVIDFARENQHPLQCTLEKAQRDALSHDRHALKRGGGQHLDPGREAPRGRNPYFGCQEQRADT